MNCRSVALLALGAVLVGCRGGRPDAPVFVQRQEWTRIGMLTDVSVLSTDADGDDVSYRFDWSNGDTSDWTGWFPSATAIQVSHAWPGAGSYHVRAQARDPRDNRSAWSEGWTAHVLPEPGYPSARLATIDLGFEAGDIEAAPDGQHVFVCGGAGVLAIISTSDNRVSTVPCVPMYSIALSRDGQFIYGRGTGLYKLNAADGTFVDSAHVGRYLYDVGVTPDGMYLYAPYADTISERLYVFRAADLEKMAEFEWDYDGPSCVTFSRDGRFAYISLYEVASVAVVRTADNTEVMRVPVLSEPVGLAALPDRDYIYVAHEDSRSVAIIRSTDNHLVGCIPILGGPTYEPLVSAAPSSEFVYVTLCMSGLSVIETRTNTEVATIDVPADAGIAPLPDGSRVYALSHSGIVTILGF